MNKKFSSIFWGFILIVSGCLALAQNQGYLKNEQPFVWAAIFGAISLLALVMYLLSGVQKWALLFPAGIFGGLATLLTMAGMGFNHPAMAAPLFVGLAIPFLAAFAIDRKKNWWALIPSGMMVFLTFVLMVAENGGGVAIGAVLFFILSASFGAVYIVRRVTWAAIVTYVLFVMGFFPILSISPRPELAGILATSAIAVPFFVVYFRAPQEKTWALIPAGVMASISLTVAVIVLSAYSNLEFTQVLAKIILFLGVAVTFAVIWLRHHKTWAMFFSLLAVAAGAANLSEGFFQTFWPVLVMLAGIYLLVRALRPTPVDPTR